MNYLYLYLQIILAIIISWIVCAIVTKIGWFSSDPNHPTYKARTDARIKVLEEADWFRFPYPGTSLIEYCHVVVFEALTSNSVSFTFAFL